MGKSYMYLEKIVHVLIALMWNKTYCSNQQNQHIMGLPSSQGVRKLSFCVHRVSEIQVT